VDINNYVFIFRISNSKIGVTMKKIFLLLTFIVTFGITLNAQLLLQENFDYGTAGNDDITLVAPTWIRHSGTAGPAYSVTDLEYSGYAGSGIGGSIKFTYGSSGNNDGDVHRTFDSLAVTGDLYVSFLLKLDSARATGDYFFHLGPKTMGTTFRLRFFAKSIEGGWQAGLTKSSGETPAYDPAVLTFGTVYLVVVKYSYNTVAVDDDLVTAYIYSSGVPSTEPGSPLVTLGPTGSGTTGDPMSIGSLAVRQGTNSPSGRIDGIRVARTWDDAPVPVELSSFSVNAVKGNVQINWTTASETNNKGFDIERKAEGKSWIKIGYVDGNGTTTQSKAYSYSDKNLSNGTYYYRLKQMDYDGTFSYSKTAEVNVNTPAVYELSQNYPNPFNPSTSIQFTVPESGFVTLKVYNMLGQEVRSLVNGIKEAGSHTIKFNADDLNSGLYLYKIEAGSFTQVRKMTLLK
jgi:hypothetical protein